MLVGKEITVLFIFSGELVALLEGVLKDGDLRLRMMLLRADSFLLMDSSRLLENSTLGLFKILLFLLN